MKHSTLYLVGVASALLSLVGSGPLGAATESESSSNMSAILPRLPIGFRLADSRMPTEASARGAATVGAPAHDHPPLPLAPRNRTVSLGANKSPSAGRSLATVLTTLACVGSLLLVVAWFVRRGPLADRGLPAEVFQHLGTKPLNSRQSIHVLRFGDKLLLVGGTATGLQSLGELTDPADVQRLADLCRPASTRAIASTLQRVVADWGREPAPVARATRANERSAGSAARRGETSHA